MKINKKKSWRCKAGAAILSLLFSVTVGCNEKTPDPKSTATPKASASADATAQPSPSPGKDEKEWIRVDIPEAGVTVSAPEPLLHSQTGEFTTTYMTPDQKYGVVISIPQDPEQDSEKALESIRAAMEKAGKVTNFRQVEWKGNPAIRFNSEMQSNGETFRSEILATILSNGDLLQFVATNGRPGMFLDSIEFIDEGGLDGGEDRQGAPEDGGEPDDMDAE